jgi:hypothetical protein
MISGIGAIVPRQEVWFEEDDSDDPNANQDQFDSGDNNHGLAPVKDAEPTEGQVADRVAELAGNTAVSLVEGTTPGSTPNEDEDVTPGSTGTATSTSAGQDPGGSGEESDENKEMTSGDTESIPPYSENLIGKCKESLKLPPDAYLPVLSVTSGDFVKGEFNISQPIAMLVFNSAKNIRRLTVRLDNPEGQYCLDLRANKLLKNLTITGSCDANLTFLRLAADKGVNVKILGCGDSGFGKYVEVKDDIATPDTEELINSCKAQLSKIAPNGEFKYLPIDFSVTRNMRLDVGDQYAVIDFKNATRINKFEVNLDHPDGKYCVNISASKSINKITFVTRCPDPGSQAVPEVIGLTANSKNSKKVKKLNFKLCTAESRLAVEESVNADIAAAKKEIDETRDRIKEIRQDKSLSPKQKREQISAEKEALKEAQKEKRQAKKELKKVKK